MCIEVITPYTISYISYNNESLTRHTENISTSICHLEI